MEECVSEVNEVHLALLAPGLDQHYHTYIHTRSGLTLFHLPKSTSVIEPHQDMPGQGEPQGQSSGNN